MNMKDVLKAQLDSRLKRTVNESVAPVATASDAAQRLSELGATLKSGMHLVKVDISLRKLKSKYPHYSDREFVQIANEMLALEEKLNNLFR